MNSRSSRLASAFPPAPAIALALLAIFLAPALRAEPLPTVAKKTEGFERRDGLLPLYVDRQMDGSGKAQLRHGQRRRGRAAAGRMNQRPAKMTAMPPAASAAGVVSFKINLAIR